MHTCPNCGIALRRFDAFTYGNVTIAESTEIVFKGQQVKFSGTVKMITEALIRAQGRPMTRQALLDVLDADAEERTIDVYIRRARQAFEKIDPKFDQLPCVRDFGYRWQKKGEDVALKLVA